MKRAIDVVVSASGLLASAPLLLLLWMLVRLVIGNPVLFRQIRPGLGGKPFVMIKFRTMRNVCNSHGVSLPDEQRLTRLGRILRSSSLDELPELWNVLMGDMSLVGPRPLLMEYLPLYSREQARRHEVRPGITGWAQVNGRNALTWEEKFTHDVWYVENRSLWLDLRILWMTVIKVFAREGIAAPDCDTMPAFTGNARQPGDK